MKNDMFKPSILYMTPQETLQYFREAANKWRIQDYLEEYEDAIDEFEQQNTIYTKEQI